MENKLFPAISCLDEDTELARQLRAYAGIAQSSFSPIHHALFVGPYGSGRFQLARSFAKACSSMIRELDPRTVTETLNESLSQLSDGEVLFAEDLQQLDASLHAPFCSALKDFFIPGYYSRRGSPKKPQSLKRFRCVAVSDLSILSSSTCLVACFPVSVVYRSRGVMQLYEAEGRSGLPLKDPHQLSPTEFEILVAKLLSAMGLQAETTKASGDGGIDVVAKLDQPIIGGRYIIQCKRFRNPVGVSVVRELFGTLMRDGASKGILITTSEFSAQARSFAENLPLELIDGAQLRQLIAKYRDRIENNNEGRRN